MTLQTLESKAAHQTAEAPSVPLEPLREGGHGSQIAHSPPLQKPRSVSLRRLTLFAGTGLLIWVAWHVAGGQMYTTRSTFAFSLGVAGGAMMIMLLSYPVRKHVRAFRHWGALKHWFRLHMYLGIAGPTLILFHSTFHVRSPNAAIAMGCMLLVVLSGIIGRFVYKKIHKGLYGRRLSFEKVQQHFWGQSKPTASRLAFAPDVESALQRFHEYALQRPTRLPHSIWHFLTLGIARQLLALQCRHMLKEHFRKPDMADVGIDRSQAIRLVTTYLREVQRVAQFQTYERLFSLWHVLHIPLIYLLAASGIFHVIAVYMY